jgi:hypothetical protein
VRSRLLKTTVLAAVADAIATLVTVWWNSRPRLSLKCCLMGHDYWIRRAADRLYLECFECGHQTRGWVTGKRHSTEQAGAFETAAMSRRKERSVPALVRSF